MPRSALRIFLYCLIFGLIFFGLSSDSFAATTPFRSANTVTADGSPAYTNLSNCSFTDGFTCDRSLATSYGNLYFRDFGDFGIPSGAVVTHIRLRVTGKASAPTLGLFAAISRLGNPPPLFYESCQSPSDLWRMYALNSSVIAVYNALTPLTNGYLAVCLTPENIQTNNFIFQLHYANGSPWSANIDNFELAFDYNIPPPSPTPTPTPSPTPTPPAPFLDLPWDYEGDGMSFTEAALNINSFFDHEYPLLSTNLGDQPGTGDSVITFIGPPRSTEKYSLHDGYDYGTPAMVENGDPVLAAAAGTATFINSCTPCGNAIHIDHGNGYQTRYYHLQVDGLITNVPGQNTHVNKGEQIGKVGATGNVIPTGEDGAHLHFMVVKDKNNDGNFNDNIPDGITDPFGWQSESVDPWEIYSFFYSGENRTGIKSYYLWMSNIDALSASLSANGGVFNSGRTSVSFPAGATLQDLLLKILSSPAKKLSDLITSIGSTAEILATDSSGNPVTTFNTSLTVEIDFAGFDLSKYQINSLSIYSSSDGVNWQKENTSVDLLNEKASTEVTHLTQFALMAERVDTIPASTSAALSGEMGQGGWFRSSVSATLASQDNDGGLGVDYILYKKDSEDWQEYLTPINFSVEGKHSIEYYSVDNDGNIEDRKTMAFAIDKTPPELSASYSARTKNFLFEGKDGTEYANVLTTDESGNKKIVTTDKAGNSLTAIAKISLGSTSSSIGFLSLKYNSSPSAVLVTNKLATSLKYYKKTTQLTSVSQTYSENSKNLIGATYEASTNKTAIYTYDRRGKPVLKEELTGMRLLKLNTENGKLKYSY